MIIDIISTLFIFSLPWITLAAIMRIADKQSSNLTRMYNESRQEE